MGRWKVGTGEKKVGEEKSRALIFALDFSSPTFFSPVPTFPRPTICPWVPEDVCELTKSFYSVLRTQNVCGIPGTCVDTRDVAILLDGSRSMGIDGFNSIKQFAVDMVRGMHVGPDKSHVSVVLLTLDPTVVFDLKTHPSALELETAISQILYNEGATGMNQLKILNHPFRSLHPYYTSRKHSPNSKYSVIHIALQPCVYSYVVVSTPNSNSFSYCRHD